MSAANRLIHEKSPYLLQHAHNPVDWYAWGEEAFERARREDKPIFLSVGYSTCHWCHVMERESFEDPEIAALMNELFINVKVDREERPDVDRVYMTFVQATTGGGGWPMSVWLTPALKPFFGGTYFPPDDRYGRPGFPTLLQSIAAAWHDNRDKLAQSADEVLDQLRQALARAETPTLLDNATLHGGFKSFEAMYDERHGGFGGAPKFPRPVAHAFLLRYHARTGDEDAAEMVLATLRQMAAGGIHDHLGGGFHRYAVDRTWHVPHFEKMLYDQAQLATSYLEAHRLRPEPLFEQTARGIFEYVLADLLDGECGAFYSAEDADSAVAQGSDRKAEGAFYVWRQEEIDELLGEIAQLFSLHYGTRPEGNADDPHGELTGKNVLHVTQPLEQTAERFGCTVEHARDQLADGRRRLRAARARRPRPDLDDKILTAWNGLMISALARGHQVLDEPRYLAAAERAARFVTERLCHPTDGRLLRRFRAGEAAFAGNLEDYAALIGGLLDLYEAGFELRWLQRAEQLADRAMELFFDGAEGGFFATSGDDRSVLLRIKDDYDGAEPSGNSSMTCNLLRLGRLLDRGDLIDAAARTLRAFSSRLQRAPQVMPQMLVALDMSRAPGTQLVIAGQRDDPDASALLRVIHRHPLPGRVLLWADETFKAALGQRLPFVVPMGPVEGRAAVYLCREQRCQRPTTDPAELEQMLERA